MKINGRITILFDKEGIDIEVHDDDASITFLRIRLSPKQTLQAFSRLAHTKCESTLVFGMEKLGKVMETETITFRVPHNLPYNKEKAMPTLLPLLKKATPKGWIADANFGSQSSFLNEGYKSYARTVIRRWVKKSK